MDKGAKVFFNGKEHLVAAEYHDWSLLRYLREILHLTGTKQGCDSRGTCGLCKVIINGRARISCRTKMGRLNGAVIETIESLAPENELPHPLLQTVIQDGIFQCGFCAPGAILSAKALLDENLYPSEKDIESAISGTLCRCAGLNRMDRSIIRAAAILRGDAASNWTDEDTANRYKDIEKLTGKLKFTDDLNFPGMLIGKALRSKVPHGKVKRVDTSIAESMPGIIKVLTSKDIPGENIFGLMVPDQQVFCDDVVRYVGDTLALVIGEREDQVVDALNAIDVDIEPLPVMDTVFEALKSDAPILHKRLKEIYPDKPNVLKHLHIHKGNPDQGFEEADLIYEQTYHVPFIEHAYMETETSIGVLTEDDRIKVFVGSQGPTNDQVQIAKVLGFPEERVQIAHMYMGGGFGGKEDIAGQIHAALAAFHTGRPVKIHWNREESILTSYKRHAADLFYKMGMKNDGTLVAADVKIYADTGAYASVGKEVLFRMMAFACGPYEVPNVEVNAFSVHTNNNPCGAFRGYGSTQVTFAAEVHLQHMFDELGLDPIDTRLKNALNIGKVTITGDVITEDVGAGMVQCLEAVSAALSKTSLPDLEENERLGIGIACAYKNVGLGANIPDRAGVQVSLESDGKILVRHGAADMGQGSEEVVLTIASMILGVPISDIRVHTGDTHEDPHGGMTTASRATFITGNAARLAVEGFKKKLWKEVSVEFNVSPETLVIENGIFVNNETGQAYISLESLATGTIPFIYQEIYDAPVTQPPSEYVESYPDLPDSPLHFAYDFGAQAAIVVVNEVTGETTVKKIIAAHDSGTPIIYQNVIGQIEGAVVQGLGYALSESYEIVKGIPKSLRLRDMGLLRFRDLPEIVPIPIITPHPKGPFGAKGVGELALTPTAPAVVNAIHDAVGVWVRDLPAKKEKIIQALQDKETKNSGIEE